MNMITRRLFQYCSYIIPACAFAIAAWNIVDLIAYSDGPLTKFKLKLVFFIFLTFLCGLLFGLRISKDRWFKGEAQRQEGD